jgi:quinolinate synthase
VHVRFTAKQIEKVRAEHPGIRVIVHPEVPFDVLQACRRQRLRPNTS